jgi:hypothetical protein
MARPKVAQGHRNRVLDLPAMRCLLAVFAQTDDASVAIHSVGAAWDAPSIVPGYEFPVHALLGFVSLSSREADTRTVRPEDRCEAGRHSGEDEGGSPHATLRASVRGVVTHVGEARGGKPGGPLAASFASHDAFGIWYGHEYGACTDFCMTF